MLPRRLTLLLPLLLVAGGLVWLWAGGCFDRLALWAAAEQREAQNAIARAVRAIKQGDAGALSGLMTVAFLYGVFHAAGPGHGKILIGGYGMTRAVPALRLAGFALASSLAQSLTAVLMVVAGIGLLSWTRTQVTDLADGWLSLASYLAIAMVGLWLALRGLRGLVRPEQAGCGHAHAHDHVSHDHDTHDHDHDDAPHDHGAHDHHAHHHHAHDHGTCGHAHAPTPEEVARVHSLRDGLILIGAVAIRPCTGALFLLIITWRMDILPAGIAGTFAMGLGTASVTVAAALASVWLRGGTLDRLRKLLPDETLAARIAATTELAVGVLVALLSLSLALRLI
ncbi:nickel/cobalt transporter [Pseudooceanicola sp.]|uniref:nickel/cobalt transporter n=1 Tax=Pseudooceanicola sp. TaxID=1914328 RepID=UPI0035C778D8